MFLFESCASLAYAHETDSNRIVNDLSRWSSKIHSAKISYIVKEKSFFQSHEKTYNLNLEYSKLHASDSECCVWLERNDTSGQWIAILFDDTVYETSKSYKITYSGKSTVKEFFDDHDELTWAFPFGQCYDVMTDMLSCPGSFRFSDTIISEERCYQIRNSEYRQNGNIDSIFRTWIISRNRWANSSFEQISWGYGGNTSHILQMCVAADYSDKTDTSFLPKARDAIYKMMHDSSYTFRTPEHMDRSPVILSKQRDLKTGDVFPISHFQTIDHNDVDISTPHTKLILLDFSYMGCEPCRMAIPALSGIYAAYRDSGVDIYGIDPYDKNEKEIFMKYKKRYHLDYPVLFSDKKTVTEDLGIQSFPTFIILDHTMKIRYISKGAGYFNGFLQRKIEELLAE